MPTICPYPEPAQSSPYPTSHFLKIHLNIILPSNPVYPKWSIALKFPQQNPLYVSLLPHTCYMSCPSHSSRFYHLNNIGWRVQIIKLLIMLTPLPCYLVPLRPKYSPLHPILKHSQPTFLPQCERPNFTVIQNNRQNYSSVYLNLYILDIKLETKDSVPNDSKHSLTSVSSLFLPE